MLYVFYRKNFNTTIVNPYKNVEKMIPLDVKYLSK
jgi:hypothetical protein